MRTILALGFSAVLAALMFGSQDTQPQKSNPKPLTNQDVVDMLKAGLSQEIVIVKINASTCEFDTSPATLKVLKAANIPDAVVLAMVQAPGLTSIRTGDSVASTRAAIRGNDTAEVARPARVDCNHADLVPVFSAPRTQQNSSKVVSNSVEVFTVKCGDRITILGPVADLASWLKIRTADGQVGFISGGVLTLLPGAESEKQTLEKKKREETQKAADDFDDCRVRAQNEYEKKLNLVNTLTLTPLQRVYASSRLKQNLDAELKVCRSQYESRLKGIEGE